MVITVKFYTRYLILPPFLPFLEFALMRPPFHLDDDQASVVTEIIDYNPAAHSPVMFGHMYEKVEQADTDILSEFDPAVSHPATAGYTLVEKPSREPTPPPGPKPPKDTCKLVTINAGFVIYINVILTIYWSFFLRWKLQRSSWNLVL